MGIQTQSALIAAILLLALGINVAFQERRVEHRAAFTAFVGGAFFYNLTFFLHAVSDSDFWRRLLMLSGVVFAQVCLRFFGRYLKRNFTAARTATNVGSALCIVLLVTDLGASSWAGIPPSVLALGVYAYCIVRLYRAYRRAPARVEAVRVGYLVVGGVISWLFSALDLLPAAGVTFPTLGHLLSTLYVYFWMQVIQRSRLLDLKELLGRVLALVILSVAVAVLYTGLVVWVGESYGLFFFNTIVASVVLLLILEPLKRAVELWLGRLLFRETYELEAQLVRLRAELVNVINLGDLVDRVLKRLQASRRVTHAHVFMLEAGGRAYFRAGGIGPCDVERLDVVRGRALLDALRREKVLLLENVEQRLLDVGDDAEVSPERERLDEVRAQLEALHANLAFAFVSGDRLLGWLTVRDDRTREAFSSAEIGLIAGITAQCTSVVENSEIIERLKERDRLSVIGEMATGMAHEIRNPLGAIKAAAQLLDPGAMDSEEGEMVEVIIEETDRLNLVLSQFLDYARPFRGGAEPVDLARVVERVATLVRAADHAPAIEVVARLGPELPPVMGDADQLTQVLLNLSRNACDAMPEGGTLTLEVRRERDPTRPGRSLVEVRVTDTGEGVPDGIRANLFIPFFTTKKQGTGLGLAVSQRIVQHHGGALHCDSTVGKGTTMSFALPGHDAADTLTGEHRRLLATETA